MELTHATIGALVGARRPTVSLALRFLEDAGLVQRDANRTWLIAAKGGVAPTVPHKLT